MKLALASLVSLSLAGAVPAGLWIDFNSDQWGGGIPVAGDPANPTNAVHHDPLYSSYHVRHERAAEFVTANYNPVFAITGPAVVGLTPTWPNTTDNRVQQSIDRGNNYDANYTNPGAYSLNLVTDFIGIDTRILNGGNGNWDGAAGTPTWLDFTLTGLPAADYSWLSIHHDTEHVHTNFNVYVDTTGTGLSFVSAGSGYMNDSTPGGGPPSGTESPGPANTFSTTFTADGTSAVIVRFEPLSGQILPGLHNQLFGVNGFQLEQIPEPSTGLLSLLAAAFLLRRHRQPPGQQR